MSLSSSPNRTFTAEWLTYCVGFGRNDPIKNGTLTSDGQIFNTSDAYCSRSAALRDLLVMTFNFTHEYDGIQGWHAASLFSQLSRSDTALRQAYCLNPAQDNDCTAWSLCPQPDISGPLVTLAAVVTHVGLAVLLWLEHDVSVVFWSHIYTVFAILITTFITMANGQLARSHAFSAGILIVSPPTLYIWFCASRACISRVERTQLHKMMRHLHNRAVALATAVVWLTLAGLIASPDAAQWFSQRKCDGQGLLYGQLGISEWWAVYWAVLVVPFLLALAFSRFHRWAKRSHKLVAVADALNRPWNKLHASAQFSILAFFPTAVFFLVLVMVLRTITELASEDDDTMDKAKAWRPMAFLLYTWLPLYFWVLIFFWKDYIVWERASNYFDRTWSRLHNTVQFFIVVGLPSFFWLAVVLPNMVQPDAEWISYGQLLALLATAPVVAGVIRAIFLVLTKARPAAQNQTLPSSDSTHSLPQRTHQI